MEKGLEAICQTEDELINKNLIPCMPKQMIENWILADKPTLKSNLCTAEDDRNIGMDYKESNAEELGHGKDRLNEIIRLVNSVRKKGRRSLKLGVSEFYEPKGKEINLEKLKQLPSYEEFREALVNNLKEQNLLEQNYDS